jgi:hypothetical protein
MKLKGNTYELTFYCPGCQEVHKLKTANRWFWNGSRIYPTITPEIISKITYRNEARAPDFCRVRILEGRLHYGESFHRYGGKEIDMVDF